MKMFSRPASSAFGACAVAAILVGCAGSQTDLGVSAPQQNAAQANSNMRSGATQSLFTSPMLTAITLPCTGIQRASS